MTPDIWVPVKVLPGKEALDFFVQKWKETGGMPFNGEFQTPDTKDPRRLMTTDIDFVSHCITDIDMSTYNDDKRTVQMRCRFVGPHGAEAMEKYLSNNIRFGARVVEGKDSSTGDHVQRIVTFDCIQNPGFTRKDLIDDIKEGKAIAAEEKERKRRNRK